jgi:hypothetical protein
VLDARERRSRARRIHGSDALRVEPAEPPGELERRGERLLHRYLLVEEEADQKRERLAGEKLVRLVVLREVEAVGSDGRHAPILCRPQLAAARLIRHASVTLSTQSVNHPRTSRR